MSNRDTLFGWIKNEICPYGQFSDYVQITANSDSSSRTNVNLYSHDYCYHITCTEDSNYLGISYSCRKPRAGEDWTRGNDLPDGLFNRKTWEKIKSAIIKNEFVRIAKSRRNELGMGFETPEIAKKTMRDLFTFQKMKCWTKIPDEFIETQN